MSLRINIKKGLIILFIYIILTGFFFMLSDYMRKLENNYSEDYDYLEICDEN